MLRTKQLHEEQMSLNLYVDRGSLRAHSMLDIWLSKLGMDVLMLRFWRQ